MQPGDVHITHADTSRLRALTGLAGRTIPIEQGVQRFVHWYREFHGEIATAQRSAPLRELAA
jgi:UDP-glucuronate 4-epimerase